MARKSKHKYWDINPIKNIPSQYKIVFGERSNGKTYGTMLNALDEYFTNGSQFAYVRRQAEDIKASSMKDLFTAMEHNSEITRLSGGAWNGITYRSGAFWLLATDMEGQKVVSDEPIGHVFAISAMEHKKSLSYPKIRNIIFDEFISRTIYLHDEFNLFMNVLSTIIRDRDDVTIWMLGNTVSKDCPYFREMRLTNVTKQKKGTIDTYVFDRGEVKMVVAVEYTENLASKKSDRYFIFDNPKLAMITSGSWEFAMYPHLFEKYRPIQVIFEFFIHYRQTIIHCEVVDGKTGVFIYAHEKTTPIKAVDRDLVYHPDPNNRPNYRVDITRPQYKIEQKIINLIQQERICFQDNEVGEVFNDYLKWCRSHSVIKA